MDSLIFEVLIIILVFLVFYLIMEFKFKHFIPQKYNNLFIVIMFLIVYGERYFKTADSSYALIFILFVIVGIYPFLKKDKIYFISALDKKIIKENSTKISDTIEDFKNNHLAENSDIIFTNNKLTRKLTFKNVSKPQIKECLDLLENYLNIKRKDYTFNNYSIYYIKSFIFPLIILLAAAFSLIKLSDYYPKIEVSELINIGNEYKIGNTEGNINNYGLVAETDDSIYYIKDFILYKSDKDLKNETVIVDKPLNNGKDTINIVDGWIFFRQGKEIKRVKTNGANLETIFKGYSLDVHVVGNLVYFISIKDDKKIICIDVNGQNKMILSEKNVDDMAICHGKIYYSYENKDGGYLKAMNLDGSDIQTIDNVKTRSMIVDENYIYYIDDSEEILYRMDMKKKTKEKLSDDKILKFIIYDNTITYTLKNPDNSSWLYKGLFIMGADGSNVTVLDGENYLDEIGMGVTKEHVFYSSTNGKEQPSLKIIYKH